MRILIALLLLGFVIFFHELGHFLLAKANHITVLEFALGMGPKILSFERGGTVYAWRLLPIGGSCSMLGEDDPDCKDLDGSFERAALWRRALVVAAGPVFNFIMALVGAMILIAAVGADPANITEVPAGSPAAQAGLMAGDRIIRYEGNGIANASELYTDILLSDIPTDKIDITVRRGREKIRFSYVPETETRYMLGFSFQDTNEGEGVLVTSLTKNSVLRTSGLRAGDVISAIDGHAIADMNALVAYLDAHPFDGSPVDVTYLHNGREAIAEDLVPEKELQASLGFSFNLAREKQNFAGWLSYSFGEVRYWIHVVIRSLGGLISGQFSMEDMSGPVGIVTTIGDAYEEARPFGLKAALVTLVNLMVLLSANLGVMNLIPFPALDGGRLLMMLIELLRGRPADRRWEARLNYVGLMVLMAFMLFVSFQDILKLT